MEDILRKTAKGAGIAFVGLFLGKFLKFITYVLFARLLGPGDYGLVSLGIAILGVLGIFCVLGLVFEVTIFIA